jgi:hypothetical protein
VCVTPAFSVFISAADSSHSQSAPPFDIDRCCLHQSPVLNCCASFLFAKKKIPLRSLSVSFYCHSPHSTDPCGRKRFPFSPHPANHDNVRTIVVDVSRTCPIFFSSLTFFSIGSLIFICSGSSHAKINNLTNLWWRVVGLTLLSIADLIGNKNGESKTKAAELFASLIIICLLHR